MQALRHSECCGDNITPIVLLDNNENYAFTGVKWSFFDILSPTLKVRRSGGEKKSLEYF